MKILLVGRLRYLAIIFPLKRATGLSQEHRERNTQYTRTTTIAALSVEISRNFILLHIYFCTRVYRIDIGTLVYSYIRILNKEIALVLNYLNLA